MCSHRMSQSSWGFEQLLQVCQRVRSRRDRSARCADGQREARENTSLRRRAVPGSTVLRAS